MSAELKLTETFNKQNLNLIYKFNEIYIFFSNFHFQFIEEVVVAWWGLVAVVVVVATLM